MEVLRAIFWVAIWSLTVGWTIGASAYFQNIVSGEAALMAGPIASAISNLCWLLIAAYRFFWKYGAEIKGTFKNLEFDGILERRGR